MTTSATSFIPPVTLEEGRYYWAVTPLDPENHEGRRSVVRSFSWAWPSATTPTLRDLVSAPELFDPLLTWTQVPGAARYEIDVNFSQDFAAGSRVCCSSPTIATGFSPTKIFANNTYYWRVRPVNIHGGEGVWTMGQSFTKTFDNVPPVAGSSIANLHMRDNFGDGGPKPAGWATASPVLVWNPVPGASGYEVNVIPMSASGCDWTARGWDVDTAVTAWTPLGTGHKSAPYPSGSTGIAADGAKLASGSHYCARVRAIGDTSTAGGRIYGDYTYLSDAFSYAPASASGGVAAPSGGDYISPAGGAKVDQKPLFTWRPIAGAQSYWVIVSRDPSFTTLVDYAFTQIPAYAPRRGGSPRTYADETTSYYWAVVPAANADGTWLAIDPLHASSANFQKQSTPPTLVAPSKGQVLPATQPQFQWTPVTGALNYRLQVSTDPNFGSKFLDNVVTPSTSYVSDTVYPAQATLYWRVQANDETKTALTWSATGTFKQVLPAPVPVAKIRRSDSIQPLRWKPIAGAVGYDVEVTQPNGRTATFSNIPTPAAVPVELKGSGVFRWQVRADFAKGGFGTVSGPFSRPVAFTRTVTPPKGERTTVSGRSLLLRWAERPGVDSYRVEISSRPDFSDRVDSETTEAPMLAPTLTQHGFSKGGTYYWHVAATDADGNTGNFSPTRRFRFDGTGK